MLSLGAKEKPLIGDARSFEQEVSPLLPSLRAYCRSMARSRWDADDLEQETLGKAYARFVQMGGMPLTKTYLYRIASNAWIDKHRRAREVYKAPDWHGWEAVSCTKGAREETEGTRWAAAQLVAWLTPKQRTALLLIEAFGFTLQETAERLSMTEGSVKSALHRGRARLKRVSAADEEEALSAAVYETANAYVHALRHGLVDAVIALGAAERPAMLGGSVGTGSLGMPVLVVRRAAAWAGMAVTSEGACTVVIGGRAPRVLSIRAGDAIAA
jgi:RNA polymerase sigma factor (sigma-70 family)